MKQELDVRFDVSWRHPSLGLKSPFLPFDLSLSDLHTSLCSPLSRHRQFPLRIRVKPELSAKGLLLSKAISVSAMRHPRSTPFQALGTPIFILLQTPLGLVVRSLEVPSQLGKGMILGVLLLRLKISFLKTDDLSQKVWGGTSRSEVTGLILSLNGYRILEERGNCDGPLDFAQQVREGFLQKDENGVPKA